MQQKLQKIFYLSGFILLAFALIFNKILLEKFFTSDHCIQFPNSYLVYLFQAFCFTWGLLLVLFVKKNKQMLNISVGLVISILFVILLEITAKIILSAKTNEIVTEFSSGPVYKVDSACGFVLIPGRNTDVVKLINGDTVYNVLYSVDSFGRRFSVGQKTTDSSEFLAFFGCSLTFGEGLDDSQTLPSLVCNASENVAVYNYACEGYGTNQVLAQVSGRNLKEEIPEKKGIGIYVYFDGHIGRNTGCMSVYNLWGENMPYYFLEEGSLKRNGSFNTGRPFVSLIYKLLGKSSLLKLFHIDLPFGVRDKDILLTRKMILEIKNNFMDNFPSGEFITLIYPGSGYCNKLLPLLEKSGIRYLDYSGLFSRQAKGYFIPGDNHPSGKANQFLAEKIVTDLKLKRD